MKRGYIKSFLAGFLIFGIAILPTLISTKGIWIYYGDFNVQQIPFYIHVHDAIRSGNFLYDWSTDLGGSLLGCYSFYLTGSPFFWLTLPFDSWMLPYLMPWISALKYAVMALTAFAYAKRHLKTQEGAFIAALLYAFSGYQGAVLVYNHFHDVMAFFPLYLLLFENMVEKRKRAGFTLMTAFMAILNYYFFVGEAVFLIIYFVTCYMFTEEKFSHKLGLLWRSAYTAITGVLLACAYLVPAVYYTMGNSRLSETLSGYDLVAYSEPTMLWGIIKNTVMLPDISGLNSMYNLSYSRVSGVAAYIPMFSIAGVVAFFLYNKERMWQKRLIITCLIFAAIPVLNSLFSAFNSEYYARWFFMPILIMALMTASLVENAEEREKTGEYLLKGALLVTVITSFIAISAVFPAENDDGEKTILGALKNPEQLIEEIIFSAVMIILLFLYIQFLMKKKTFVTGLVVMAACLLTTATMLVSGSVLVDSDRKTGFIEQALKGESPVEDISDTYFRIETEEDIYNYPLLWDDAHSITSFISTIPDSTLEFYEKFGVHRKVTSNLSTSKMGMRAFLSAKYFIKENGNAIERIGRVDDMTELKGYSLSEDVGEYSLYENENFIPMGYTFDSYITESEFEEADYGSQAKDRMLVRTLVLSDEAASKYGELLEHADPSEFESTSQKQFTDACSERRKTACTDFETSTYGFTANIDMEKENLLFFTVPYETGFTAYVDGEETEVIKADYGFMAVKVPEGEHTVTFTYMLSNFKYGIYLSIAGVVIFLLWLSLTHKAKK